MSLTDVFQAWTESSIELAPSAAIVASVGLRHLMDQWGVWQASPTPLTRLIGLSPLRQMHARPTHRTPPLRSAKACRAVGRQVSLRSFKTKGWDDSVRSKIAKGHFVQGMQHPRIFSWGHIGRGWTNIAPILLQCGRPGISEKEDMECAKGP